MPAAHESKYPEPGPSRAFWRGRWILVLTVGVSLVVGPLYWRSVVSPADDAAATFEETVDHLEMAYALKTIDRLSPASIDTSDSTPAIMWFAIRETLVGISFVAVPLLLIGVIFNWAGLDIGSYGPTVAVWAACVSVAAAVVFTWWLPRLHLVDNAPLSQRSPPQSISASSAEVQRPFM